MGMLCDVLYTFKMQNSSQHALFVILQLTDVKMQNKEWRLWNFKMLLFRPTIYVGLKIMGGTINYVYVNTKYPTG